MKGQKIRVFHLFIDIDVSLQEHVVIFSYFRAKSGVIFNQRHIDISSLLWRHAASTKEKSTGLDLDLYTG